MKVTVAIGLAGVVLLAPLVSASAGSRPSEPAPAMAAVAGGDIVTSIRQMGLNPIGEPVRRGPYYVLHAYDPRGIEMRVVADADFGDILSVVPARALNAVYAPQYERVPRIIHIPPRGETEHGAPPVERAVPQPGKRGDAAPGAPRRAVMSAPPPPAERSLAPPQSAPRADTPKTTP